MSEKSFYQYLEDAQKGDSKAKEICVEKNIGLVWSVVNRFKSPSFSSQDLFQIGCVGLMKAINNFDTSYEVMFSTYAVPIILGEIKRHFRDEGRIKVSRTLKERYLSVLKVKDELTQILQREPTYQEIAERLGCDEGEVTLSLEANQFLASMDETIYQKDGSAIRYEDKAEDKRKIDIPMQIALRQEIGHLDERERLLLYYRYDLDYNQQTIAEKLNISQVQVSRLEKKILQKLKEKLTVAD